MPITVSFWMRIVPEVEYWIVRIRTTPDQISRPASVTTNDGTPAFVITIACRNPMVVVMARAMPIAAHAGQFEASGPEQEGHQDAPDGAHERDRQVDLPDQQHEHDPDRDRRHRGHLQQQVREVPLG